jgi:hypothetical protein
MSLSKDVPRIDYFHANALLVSGAEDGSFKCIVRDVTFGHSEGEQVKWSSSAAELKMRCVFKPEPRHYDVHFVDEDVQESFLSFVEALNIIIIERKSTVVVATDLCGLLYSAFTRRIAALRLAPHFGADPSYPFTLQSLKYVAMQLQGLCLRQLLVALPEDVVPICNVTGVRFVYVNSWIHMEYKTTARITLPPTLVLEPMEQFNLPGAFRRERNEALYDLVAHCSKPEILEDGEFCY